MTRYLLLLTVVFFSFCAKEATDWDESTLAVVNERSISSGDFLTQAESIKNMPGVNLNSADGRTKVLREMVNEELVFQQALKENFHLTKLKLKHEIVKEYLKENFSKDIPTVTDAQVEEFYSQNSGVIDEIRASHVLIKFNKEDANQKKNALQKIEKIRKDIVTGQISFADAARKYSDDGSASKGGDLNWFNFSVMTEPFSKAAFSLNIIGDITPVVETDFGYHIIQLTDDFRGLDRNREKIRWKFYQDAMKSKVDTYFYDLRENAKIEFTKKDIMSIEVPHS